MNEFYTNKYGRYCFVEFVVLLNRLCRGLQIRPKNHIPFVRKYLYLAKIINLLYLKKVIYCYFRQKSAV